MKMKSFSTAEFRIVPLDDLLNENNKTQPILVYENEQQILDVEKNSEGYDYESLIRQNTL